MNKKTLLLLAICGLVTLMVLVICVSWFVNRRVSVRAYDTQPVTGTVYTIVNRHSNEFLEVYNDVRQDSAFVDQRSANGCACQYWAFCSVDSSLQSNAFYLYNVGTSGEGTNYVLHVPYASTIPQMILEQYHQVSGDLSEEWQITIAQDNGQSNGYVYLQNVNSHLVADDYLFSKDDMSAVIQWSFNVGGTDNQQWQLRPVPGASPFACP